MLLDPSEKPVVAVLGDSITRGFPEGLSWVKPLERRLGIEIMNAGVNGDTLQGMLMRIQADIVEKSPDICVVTGGTNDAYLGYSVDEMKHYIMEMLQILEVSGVIPVIGTPIPILYPSCEENLQMFREWVEVVCPYVIPFHQPFFERGRIQVQLIPDGVHPSETGYRLMSDVAEMTLRKIATF